MLNLEVSKMKKKKNPPVKILPKQETKQKSKNSLERRTRNSLSRSEIINAALAIVNEEGFEKLSMRNIANKLKCSVASPYAHFENQEELLKSLIQYGETILNSMLKTAIEKNPEIFDQLTAIAHAYWDFAKEHRELHKIMFNTGGPIHKAALSNMPISYRIFLRTIKNGFKTGVFHTDMQNYHSVARTMWAWIYGLMVLDLAGVLQMKAGGDSPLDEGLEYFKMILRRR